MKIKEFLKLFEGYNSEAELIIQKHNSNNPIIGVMTSDNCTHCAKNVYLRIGQKSLVSNF